MKPFIEAIEAHMGLVRGPGYHLSGEDDTVPARSRLELEPMQQEIRGGMQADFAEDPSPEGSAPQPALEQAEAGPVEFALPLGLLGLLLWLAGAALALICAGDRSPRAPVQGLLGRVVDGLPECRLGRVVATTSTPFGGVS